MGAAIGAIDADFISICLSMESARSENDDYITDYVQCLMSLDGNARNSENENTVLSGSPPAEGEPANTTIAITDQSEIKEVASITTGSAKEPEVGMEFESDEAAKTFYNNMQALGFPFRVGRLGVQRS
ncbi:hypothetical protein ACMD2_19568 [Ananas comosus]|uniref:Uncharacterized protein n=1 Tax=Ananas comosus TaxID=4615 RepID=A0A199W2W3_ANACO|nr:hypothetical protein ACMD2_19568 [Ananas comosus]